MRKLAVSAAAAGLVACFLFLPVIDAFTFTEVRAEKPAVHYIPIRGDEEFVIRYTHSIHLSDVLESYTVTKDRKIRLVKMEYEDLAIGLPGHAEAGETFTDRNGKYTLEYEDRVLDAFVLYVADIDTDLEFRHAGRRYDLKQKLERGKSYRFEAEKLSLFDLMKGMNMNGR
ncbi:DUF1850 domain-containing protein [Bhargavaea ullalensis]|uniref:DUF1850 domain-containing protein n=1 Tax=Bhargavaea ullalensis TaxID=1265685 RepID=A0ABV2GBM7_9BACL